MLATTSASPLALSNRGHGVGGGRSKPSNLTFLESMQDLQGHLDHMRHSNRLITCDSEVCVCVFGLTTACLQGCARACVGLPLQAPRNRQFCKKLKIVSLSCL